MAKHLTLAERQFLHRMVKAKKSKAEIGALMKRHRRLITVGRPSMQTSFARLKG